MLKKWTIYKITNPTGRVYIGVTCNYKKRVAAYRGLDCKTQPIIYKSIIKYGIEAHLIEVIDSFESTWSFAKGKEMFWIRTYMSNSNKYSDKFGMNVTDGGEGTLGRFKTDEEKSAISRRNKGFRHTEEAKIKIGEAAKGNRYNAGRKHTDVWKKQASERSIGNKHNIGRKQSAETIEKRVSKIRGRKMPEHISVAIRKRITEAVGRPILQYDLNGVFLREFVSISDAARILNWERALIRKSLRGLYKHTNGWIFKYKNNIP